VITGRSEKDQAATLLLLHTVQDDPHGDTAMQETCYT
jgi:hypothetical protein